ncbi:hypothetical protein HHK36_007732 [Tetracentron sinense]|uniref:Uncharacterized protein n=1 Tax=Tetracentron sinense TaxID=13715 RepID=A0A834ZF38_TETSI|nr:hypothetical protein HHK36_007732 [Tetracentron sinense]
MLRCRADVEEGDNFMGSLTKDLSFRIVKVISFLVIFVAGVVLGLAASAHVTRYFTSKTEIFFPTNYSLPTREKDCSSIRTCKKEDCLSIKSIVNPGYLTHSMTDKELFWRASLVPKKEEYPYKRVPKVAFMFLTRGPLPLSPLWDRFFRGHEELFSIYVHALPGYKLNVSRTSAFYGRQIPSQSIGQGSINIASPALQPSFSPKEMISLEDNSLPLYPPIDDVKLLRVSLLNVSESDSEYPRTMELVYLHEKLDESISMEEMTDDFGNGTLMDVQWGTITLADGERRLLANALLNFSNERFILLSESCIPIYNFRTVYKYLIYSAHSFVDSYDDPTRYGRGRYSRHMLPDIKLAQWRKGSQWFELNRALAVNIIADTKYYSLFRKYCKPSCYPDEHYLPTFLNMFHGPLNANRSVTWVDWSRGGPHPATYGRVDITEGFIQSIRNNGTVCLYNSQRRSVCHLFARKIPWILSSGIRAVVLGSSFGYRFALGVTVASGLVLHVSLVVKPGKEQTSLETQFDSGFLKQLKELITQVIKEEYSAGSSLPRTPPAARHHNQNYSLPCMKLDFPRWDEDDPSGWVSRAERFFRFHRTLEASRVDIASIHLEGEAVQWYDWFEASHGIPTWATFVEGLLVRFGPSAFEDVDANRARDWSERQLIGTFVEGLRPDIRREVKIYRPRTRVAVFSFARVQEEKLSEETRRTTRAFNRPNTGGNGSSSTPTRKTARLTQEELKEKTAKGIYWHCDEKWQRGHVCKQGKLLMIEPMVEQMALEMDNDEAAQEDEELIGGDDGKVTYTVHSLAGYSNPQTMKVNGLLKCQQVTVLIDTGSTNNFLDENIAKKFSIPTEDCEPIDVTLTDGGTLTCKSKCSNVKLAVQDQELRADLYLLPLGDYEVVLSIEWLRTLGDVLWNFSKLTMKFTLNEKRVTFCGRRGNVTTVSSHRMEHILKKTCKGYLLQLRSETTAMPEDSRLALAPLLSEFFDLFAEPNGLPPQRSHDHQIPLLPGSAPTNTEAAEEAFTKLKRAMTTTPVLALPNFTKTFIIESDASGIGIGVVLMQEGRPLAFTNKTLSPLHLKMSVYDKEMLAVAHAVTKWRPYLIGRRFLIRTDHRSLKYLLEQRISSMEQQKWVTKLLGYDYEIVYKKGVENLVADALSHIPEQAELHSISTPTWSTLEFIKEEQQRDPELQKIIQRLTHDLSSVPRYSLAVDHLRYKGRIILASHSTHKATVLQELHAAPSAGHSGFLRTYKHISKLFYWKWIKRDVKQFVAECKVCQ